MAAGSFTDIRSGGWTDRLLPAPLRPYAKLARLDRPIGWELLLYPCWWGLALASPGQPDPVLALLFLIGAVAMRGAGCALNDIVDREFDARVERTRSRPIPSGQVSVLQAVLFMVLLLAIGAGVLLSLDALAIWLGLGILVIVALYPFMKRVTLLAADLPRPEFQLGRRDRLGRSDRACRAPAVALYAGGIAWTLFYDTIYAHSDKTDDMAIGVKSTALRFGAASKTWLAGFAVVALLCFTLALVLAGARLWSYLFIAAAALHFAWQLRAWRLDDPADCIAKFKSNRIVGWLVLAACLLA
ncbi:MAG: 4-hydroxybenzoate octaprenyltransferase [Aliidongia sp.]